MICSNCFPRARNKSSYLQFTIPQMRAKTTSKKDLAAEKKIMSHHALVNTELKSRCSDLDPFPGGAGFSHALLIVGIGLTFPNQPAAPEIRFNTIVHHPLTLQNYTLAITILPTLFSTATPTETGVVRFNNPSDLKLHHPLFPVPLYSPFSRDS